LERASQLINELDTISYAGAAKCGVWSPIIGPNVWIALNERSGKGHEMRVIRPSEEQQSHGVCGSVGRSPFDGERHAIRKNLVLSRCDDGITAGARPGGCDNRRGKGSQRSSDSGDEGDTHFEMLETGLIYAEWELG